MPLQDPIQVVAKQTQCSPDVCLSVKKLLDDGCSVPFICRYRAAKIKDAGPSVVREIQKSLEDYEKVTKRISKILAKLSSNASTESGAITSKKKRGRQNSEDEATMSDDNVVVGPLATAPPSLTKLLERCVSMKEVDVVMASLGAGVEKAPENGTSKVKKKIEQLALDVYNGNRTPEEALARTALRECVVDSAVELDDMQLMEHCMNHLAWLVAKDSDTFELFKELLERHPPSLVSSARRKSTSSSSGSRQRKRSRSLPKSDFAGYFNFRVNVRSVKSHQVLALNRGERQKQLKIVIEFHESLYTQFVQWCHREKLKALSEFDKHRNFKTKEQASRDATIYVIPNVTNAIVKIAYNKYIKAQLKKMVKLEITDNAEKEAIHIFAQNLHNLLLKRPLHKSAIVIGIDPGFTNGCKTAILTSATNAIVKTHVFHLLGGTEAQQKKEVGAFEEVIENHNVNVIALGDGKGSRETRQLCLSTPLLAQKKMEIVNEAGTSIWSVTEDAEKDLPQLPPTLRSAVAIARRVIDPLGEYTKVDPKHLGLGMYQHDIAQSALNRALTSVLEDCVSLIGVNVNTAPPHLLQNISGLGAVKAQAIVEHRESLGPFLSREELKMVKGIGAKTFQQCSGFLRIPYDSSQSITNSPATSDVSMASSNGKKTKRQRKLSRSPTRKKGELQRQPINPLDSTWIHPEQYPAALKLIQLFYEDSATDPTNFMADFGTSAFRAALNSFIASRQDWCERLEVDEPTLKCIVSGLTTELGYVDPRNDLKDDSLSNEGLKVEEGSAISSFEEVSAGMTLCGRVLNVTSFGAFIDLGISVDGLLHTSKFGNASIRIGDELSVCVVSVDQQRRRIGLRLSSHKGAKEELQIESGHADVKK